MAVSVANASINLFADIPATHYNYGSGITGDVSQVVTADNSQYVLDTTDYNANCFKMNGYSQYANFYASITSPVTIKTFAILGPTMGSADYEYFTLATQNDPTCNSYNCYSYVSLDSWVKWGGIFDVPASAQHTYGAYMWYSGNNVMKICKIMAFAHANIAKWSITTHSAPTLPSSNKITTSYVQTGDTCFVSSSTDYLTFTFSSTVVVYGVLIWTDPTT